MRIFSGIKPSGDLHIGNYLGAIKQFVELQKENEAIFCVVDLHAITVPQDPKLLKKHTLDIAMMYLAAGINPNKSIIFIQSHVTAHAELGWILNTFTPVGELERMTQYKDALAKGKPNFGGLLNYPTLMAADILLYKTSVVPVGEEQIQHIELTRSIAERFNNKYGETFVIPKPILSKENARVMSLTNPLSKMAKSDDDLNGVISLIDSPDEIRRKIKSAVTDSGSEIKFDPEKKPAISNLLSIYDGFSEKTAKEIEKDYTGKNYAEFKNDLAEVIIEGLKPIQKRFFELQKDESQILKILRDGAEKAEPLAKVTLDVVKQKIGFVS